MRLGVASNGRVAQVAPLGKKVVTGEAAGGR